MDRTVTFKQEEISGHDPQQGLDTKTDRLTDRQSQCDFDSDFDLSHVSKTRSRHEPFEGSLVEC
jgi:hypothetical protein